jgi:hypothetical protein
MDEVSSRVRLNLPFKLTTTPRKRLFYLVLESHDGRAPGADSEEKREPVSDIDIAVADSLNVLDLKRPIREGGTVRPIALAVLRLIANSYLVGCCTGRSAGLAPLRILST